MSLIGKRDIKSLEILQYGGSELYERIGNYIVNDESK